MNISLKIKNIVLIGANVPVSLDRYFFISNHIFKEEEILPSSTYGASGTLRLFTAKYNLADTFIANPVTPGSPLYQIVLNENIPPGDDRLKDIMLSIITASKLSNCSAIGINFNWLIGFEGSEKSNEISKKYFYNEKSLLQSMFFNTADTEYGLYSSKNIKGARLKLDIKPVTYNDHLNPGLGTRKGINFNFNFHFDIKNRNVNTELINHLGNYKDYEKEAETIMLIYK